MELLKPQRKEANKTTKYPRWLERILFYFVLGIIAIFCIVFIIELVKVVLK
jgi:hypothetical protein